VFLAVNTSAENLAEESDSTKERLKTKGRLFLFSPGSVISRMAAMGRIQPFATGNNRPGAPNSRCVSEVLIIVKIVKAGTSMRAGYEQHQYFIF